MRNSFHEKYKGKKHGWLRFGKQAAAVALAAFLIFNFVIGGSIVDGESMEPTMHDGDVAVYIKLGSNYDRGDIVVVKMPLGNHIVKRIIAIEGDEVDIRGDAVFLNGEELEEEYIKGRNFVEKDSVTYPYRVQADMYFVMGDNRSESMDSRVFGSVVQEQIKGKILFTH